MFNPEINGKIVEFKKKGKPSQEEDKIGSSAVEGTLGATRESVISAERTFENSQEMKAMAHELHALRDEMSDIFEEIKSLTEKAKDKRAKEHQPVKKLKLISKKSISEGETADSLDYTIQEVRQRLESLLLRANEYQEKIENRLIKFNEEKNDITQQIKQMAGGKDKEEKLKAKKIFGQAAKRINPDRENLYNAYTEIGMMIMHGKNYLSWLEKIGGVYKE